jgi:phosphoribosylaminoimidazole (AIR) synthetase
MTELVERAGLSHEERYRTLNMGIGYTLIVPTSDVANVLAAVPEAKVVGWIEERRSGDAAVVIHPARDPR